MAKWSSYTDCSGVEHSLRHFHDATHTFTLPPTLKRPKAQKVVVRVTFGIHCFTRAPRADEQVEPCQIYHKNPEGRLFCAYRCAFGTELPKIIETILDRNCYETDRKNHVLFSSAQTADGQEYAVFFVLSRASGADCDVNMMVLSAHTRQRFRPSGKPDKFRHLLRVLVA
jgi:hypothetical protein